MAKNNITIYNSGKEISLEDINTKLIDQFAYQNKHEVPRILKIQLNRGLGTLGQNTNILNRTVEEFRIISGQQPIITKSRRSIAGFKLREDTNVGVTVTLRGKKMYSFMNRLTNLAIPRIQDFQGMEPGKFDSDGNYNFGVQEQLIFPEIDYSSIDQRRGLNITIVTSAKTIEEGFALLESYGFPFKKLKN